jgi:hypothetical protein
MTNNIAISLGNVCYSAEWAVANGLRSTKANGYKTCPFDLMVSNYNGLIKCIYEDFQHFCNPHFLILNKSGIYNTYYNFAFNHESPEHANIYLHENWPEGKNHFVNNNFKHFIDRYNCRIQSFREYLWNSNNHIIFIIQFVYDQNPNDNCMKLREALKVKYPHLNYSIRIL